MKNLISMTDSWTGFVHSISPDLIKGIQAKADGRGSIVHLSSGKYLNVDESADEIRADIKAIEEQAS